MFNVSLNSNAKANKDGELQGGAGSFYRGLRDVINDKKTTEVSLTYNDPSTQTGNFETQKVDMADILAFGDFDNRSNEQVIVQNPVPILVHRLHRAVFAQIKRSNL